MPLEKVAKDVMRPIDRYPALRDMDTVETAFEMMKPASASEKQSLIIVIGGQGDEKETIKGFISPREIVFGIADHFLKGAQRIGPIFWDGQLRAECMEAFGKPVAPIMTPIRTCIKANEKIMEAIFLLNKHQLTYLPVIDGEEVVGVIHLEDILEEIIHIVLESPESHNRKTP